MPQLVDVVSALDATSPVVPEPEQCPPPLPQMCEDMAQIIRSVEEAGFALIPAAGTATHPDWATADKMMRRLDPDTISLVNSVYNEKKIIKSSPVSDESIDQ